MKAKIANLELEISVRSPLTHLKQSPPAKDVPETTEIDLTGENFNMAPALVRVTVLDSSDVRVSKVAMYSGTELHLPQRPSKWTARRGSTARAPIGQCVSAGVGDAIVAGSLAVFDGTVAHVANAHVACDVKVVAGTRSGQLTTPAP
jgi:hypothetical protein